jgi:hypothetical protein
VQGLVVRTRDRQVSFFSLFPRQPMRILIYILFLTAQSSALSMTDSICRSDVRVLVAIGTVTVCLLPWWPFDLIF